MVIPLIKNFLRNKMSDSANAGPRRNLILLQQGFHLLIVLVDVGAGKQGCQCVDLDLVANPIYILLLT